MEALQKSFDMTFRTYWDKMYFDTSDKAVFKSSMIGTQSKTLDNGYAVYYNPDILAKKPPRPMLTTSSPNSLVEEKPLLDIPFDESRWNFLRINQSELLAYYNSKTNVISFDTSESVEKSTDKPNSDLYHFYVNIYPLAMYHALIVPDPRLKYPQSFRKDCFLDVLKCYHYCFDTDKYCVGFNSVDVASLNHLHFQVFKISEFFEKERSAIEEACKEELLRLYTSDLLEKQEIIIEELKEYSMRGFAIRAPDKLEQDSVALENIAGICERIVKLMIEKQISHTITMIGKSIFIIPCRVDNPNRSQYVQRGWIETTGVSKCSTQEAYDSTPSGQMIKELFLRDIALDEARYEDLKAEILSNLKSLELISPEILLPELALVKKISYSMI